MMATPARVGIVLSSGGIRGVFAHTGFLLGLRDLGIAYEAVAGCSAGAIVGGIVASGGDLERWSRAIVHVKRRVFWDCDPLWRILWCMVGQHGRGYIGFSGTDSAIEFCEAHLAVRRFEDCHIAFRALALSLSHNRKVVFSSGELAPRMLASAAIPVLYRPVEIDGDWYCDGAVVEFGPIDAICCSQHLDYVIVHHVSSHREGADQFRASMRSPWAMGRLVDWIVYRQRPWYLQGRALSFHACPGGCGTTIVVVEPFLPTLVWPDTAGGAEVEQAARTQVIDILGPHVTRLLKRPM